jgi:hypothetical protein
MMEHFLTIQILINVASVYFAFSVAVLSCCLYDLLALLSYGHKRARNKRIGPGGGTRRLHQISDLHRSWGRNRIDERLKGLALFRCDTAVIGSNTINANDNRAPVAMAA